MRGVTRVGSGHVRRESIEATDRFAKAELRELLDRQLCVVRTAPARTEAPQEVKRGLGEALGQFLVSLVSKYP